MTFVIILFVVVLFYLFPVFRYAVFHPFKVLSNACRDVYKFFRYKKYNEFKDYGRMTMYIANDKQPFGSGKTLNLVRYVTNVYSEYNGRSVWSPVSHSFVPQQVRIFSNIKLYGIPYFHLESEQQIIEASETNDPSVIYLFVIDEMGTQWNNRNWKKNLSEDLLNAILQQRKAKIAIVGTVQDYSLFDATLRKLTTNVFECSKFWRFLTLKEYYARDLERAQSNSDLIVCRGVYVRFATNTLYNSYDTSEKVSKLSTDITTGEHLTNQEVLEAAGAAGSVDSLTNVKRKYRRRFKK